MMKLKQYINKIKGINFSDLIKNFIKRLILNGVKMAVAYQITIFLLGYTLFTPLLIRLFNLTPKNNVAECLDWGFSMGSATKAQQSLSGLSWDQIILGGIVMGVTYYGINYIGDYVFPSFMRYCGYTDYYSLKERMTLHLQNNNNVEAKIDTLTQNLRDVNGNLGIVNENVDALAGRAFSIETRLHRVEIENHNKIIETINVQAGNLAALITETYNRVGEVANNNIIPTQDRVDAMLLHMNSIRDLFQNHVEQSLSPTALRAEMERLIQLFNTEHANISSNLRNILRGLQDQVNVLDTSDLNSANERLQSHIAFLENVLRQHVEGGNRVREAVMEQFDQIVENAGQLVPQSSQLSTNQGSVNDVAISTENRPRYASMNSAEVANGVASTTASGYQPTAEPVLQNSSNQALRTSQPAANSDIAQIVQGQSTGNYTIEITGNEMLVRLSLSGNVNGPVAAIASNEGTTQIMRASASYLKSALTDVALGAVFSGATTLARGAIAGGLNGMLGSAGFSPIMRITSTPSTFLTSRQIEAAAKAADAGDKLGTLITVGKEFAKSAWKYI